MQQPSCDNINNHIIADKYFAAHDSTKQLYDDLSHRLFCNYINAIVNYDTHLILKKHCIYTIRTNAQIASDIRIIKNKSVHGFHKIIFTPILSNQSLCLRYIGFGNLMYTISANSKILKHQILHIDIRKKLGYE